MYKRQDYRLAIAEYIWNSFDAKASNVDIQFEANELGHISYFVISDNGEGINLSTIASTLSLIHISCPPAHNSRYKTE